LAPNELAVVIERGQDGGAEQDVDQFSVGGRRRHCVAAAQVGQLPRSRFDLNVPQRRPVVRLVAGDVMLRVLLLVHAGRPKTNGDEDAAALHDWTGLVVVLLVFRIAAGQWLFPEDVFVLLAAPG